MSGLPPHVPPEWHNHWHHFYRAGRFGGGYHHRGFGLFRRLFWLGLGAGVYAFWSSRHREHEERYRQITGGGMPDADHRESWGRHWGWGCHRRYEREGVQPPPSPPPQWQQNPSSHKDMNHADFHDEHHASSKPLNHGQWSSTTVDGRPSSPVAPALDQFSSERGSWLPWSGQRAPAGSDSTSGSSVDEQAPAHMQYPTSVDKVRRQAGEAVVDISEAALDSLLSNIQALKTKLAEVRQQQESHQAPAGQSAKDSSSGFGHHNTGSAEGPRLV